MRDLRFFIFYFFRFHLPLLNLVLPLIPSRTWEREGYELCSKWDRRHGKYATLGPTSESL